MLNLFRKTYTYEELLVKNIMERLKVLKSKNPFKYLAVQIKLSLTDDLKKNITYIFADGKVFVDDEEKLTGKERDLNLNKYCYLFNGKPKNFIELEKYEFLSSNFGVFEAVFDEALRTKKAQYGIGI